MNDIEIDKLNQGNYIIAVSGGVDSIVLLDLLSKQPDLNMIIGHVNHGIREDSNEDFELVKELARNYGLRFEYTELNMGKNSSEELARNKRYEFLNQLATKYRAKIITAHHQDDVIETAFINLIRGTGSRGLASLKSNKAISRPLLRIPKKQIINYAKTNNLIWHEDSTNLDKKILRNKIRHDIVAKMESEERAKMLRIIENASVINNNLDNELNSILRRGLHKGQPILSRSWLAKMPHDVSAEVIRKLLNDNSNKEIDKKTIDRVVVALKTLPHGKTVQASGVNITLTKRSARFKNSSKTS